MARQSILVCAIVALMLSGFGCQPFLNSQDPANGPHTTQVTVPPGAAANPAAGTPANPTTQPIIVNVTVPANPGLQTANVVHDVATNPVAQAAASSVPYGSIVLGSIALLSTIAAGYFGNSNATKGSLLNSIQSATNTSNHTDATAASIAAIEAGPAAIVPYSSTAKAAT